MLVELRHQLEAQRDRVAEQLAAVEAVEQAWSHLETVFGRGLAGAEPRADPLACTCEECGAEFARKNTKGPRPRRCPKCKNAARTARQAAKANGADTQVAPEPAPERQEHAAPEPAPELPPELPQCGYCEDPFEPTNPDQKYCSPECKAVARSDRRNRPAVPGGDREYVKALQASGGRF